MGIGGVINLVVLEQVLIVLGIELIIVVICWVDVDGGIGLFDLFNWFGIILLFNIVGFCSVVEVVLIVQLVCEVLNINWVKFEVIVDECILWFDVVELVWVVE